MPQNNPMPTERRINIRVESSQFDKWDRKRFEEGRSWQDLGMDFFGSWYAASAPKAEPAQGLAEMSAKHAELFAELVRLIENPETPYEAATGRGLRDILQAGVDRRKATAASREETVK